MRTLTTLINLHNLLEMKLSILWATLAGGVTLMLVGFVLYVLLLPNVFGNLGLSEEHMKAEPEMLWIFIGNIGGALLLAHVFDKWASITTFPTGAKAGAIFGFLIAIYAGFIQFATTVIGTSITPYIVDAFVSAFLWAIAGGVVGLILGKTASN